MHLTAQPYNFNSTYRSFAPKSSHLIQSVDFVQPVSSHHSTSMSDRAWLAGSKNWNAPDLGKHWEPVKVLGKGGQGIVGLWEYRGPKEDAPNPSKLVIKQGIVRGVGGAGLRPEHIYLHQFKLRTPPSQHIPKIYNENLIIEKGLNTNAFDKGTVHRLILEYCEGGSLDTWFHGKLRDAKSNADSKSVYH